MHAEGEEDGRRSRVTIRQVAEEAGVSIATVSRVVNGHSDVSSETREAVRRVLRERGYAGGLRARAVRGDGTGTGLVGVTMPLVHPGYFASILAGAAEALYEHDRRVVPGESDGQCDAAGGGRAWDYTAYTQPGWPTTAPDQQLFGPLWGLDDPAAGSWFPQQALRLAQDANP